MPDNVHIGGTSDKTAPAIMCSASIRRPPAKDDSTIALVDTLWGGRGPVSAPTPSHRPVRAMSARISGGLAFFVAGAATDNFYSFMNSIL